ncbi:hypothetical protein [Neobacillus sp. LXY-1]|uniref:hypothetical protein n=1 Tax=Neobacillus sp. LXY-1 TaxID=3379133 RepID=UPI003EE1B729
MKTIYTKIGDFLIQINFESKQLGRFFEKNFNIHELETVQKTDLEINIKDGYGVPFQDYHVDISKRDNQIIFQRADYSIKVEDQYRSATISVYNQLALKHALTNLFSSFIVHHNWGLLIHSSCVIENEGAHIFAGQSGAGKSTAAKLSFPRELLSDEATLVKITSEGGIVYNSPFRSEIEAKPIDQVEKLKSIQILHQALQNSRMLIPKSDAFLQLMDKVFYWPHSKEELKTISDLLLLLVKNTPVYELHFVKDNSFWKLIS